MKKFKLYFLVVVAIIIVSLQSCSKDEPETFKCTIYLNGNVWSEQMVSNCSLCTAPQGYTSSCN